MMEELKPEDYKALTEELHRLQQYHNKTIEKMVEMQHHIDELEEAVRKTSFISASKVPDESQIATDNLKYRILLATRSVTVNVPTAGDYILYSDPVKKILELRKPSPKP